MGKPIFKEIVCTLLLKPAELFPDQKSRGVATIKNTERNSFCHLCFHLNLREACSAMPVIEKSKQIGNCPSESGKEFLEAKVVLKGKVTSTMLTCPISWCSAYCRKKDLT